MTQRPNIKRADDELDAELQRRRAKAEAELQKRGWTLDGPRRTSSGFKASITKRNACVLVAGAMADALLDELLRHAREAGDRECGAWLQRWNKAAAGGGEQ